MGQSIPTSPVAVRGFRNKPQRTLIALVALVAIGLSVVAIVVSSDSNPTTETPLIGRGPAPVQQTSGTYASPAPAIVTSDTPAQRYDGGPEEGSAAIGQRSAPVEQTSGTYASPAPSHDHESDPLQDRTGFSR
jgi:hypothetical protein